MAQGTAFPTLTPKAIDVGAVKGNKPKKSPKTGAQTERTEKDTEEKDKLQPRQPVTARPTGSRPLRSSNSSRTPKTTRRRPKTPLTPAEAIQRHGEQLTPFEQSEILEYQNVYFCGSTPNKVKGIPHSQYNSGTQ